MKVRDGPDFLADAAAAAEVFAWRGQLVQAAVARTLKKAPGAVMSFCELVDTVCRDCRERFDVETADVQLAINKLCIDGVIDRRQQVCHSLRPTPPTASCQC